MPKKEKTSKYRVYEGVDKSNLELVNEYIVLKDQLKLNPDNAELAAKVNKYQLDIVQKLDYIVLSQVSKYKEFSNYEDLYQEGVIALLKSLKTFRPSKGNFFWWAHKYIDTKISREANKHSAFHVPMNKSGNFKPLKIIEESNEDKKTINDTESQFLQQELAIDKQKIVELCQRLPQEQHKIIKLIYGLDDIKPQSMNSVSRKLNMSNAKCNIILSEAHGNLRKMIKGI